MGNKHKSTLPCGIPDNPTMRHCSASTYFGLIKIGIFVSWMPLAFNQENIVTNNISSQFEIAIRPCKAKCRTATTTTRHSSPSKCSTVDSKTKIFLLKLLLIASSCPRIENT